MPLPTTVITPLPSQLSYHLSPVLSPMIVLLLIMPITACDNQLNQRLTPPPAAHTSLSASGEEIRHAVPTPHRTSVRRTVARQQLTAHGANATGSTPGDHPHPLRGARPCALETAWFSGQCTPLKRFYIWQHTTTGSHRITPEPPAQASPGYTYSGHSFVAMLPQDQRPVPNAYPVFALTSPQGEQYLTRSTTEQANLTRHHGYSQGTILFYVASGKSFGNQKIYRYKYPRPGITAQPHHYHGPWRYSFGQATDSAMSFDGSLGWVLSATLAP